MAQRTCTVDGCGKKHLARGLCGTHYNQQHQPNRHPRYERTCQACGVDYTTPRKDGMYCSLACRDDARTGTTFAERQAARAEREAKAALRAERLAALAAIAVQVQPFTPEHRACAWCGETHLASRDLKVYCTRKCKGKAKAARRRALEHGARGTYTWAEVMRLYLQLGGCAYCNEPSDEVEPDHVIPLSRGGSNSITNVVPCCKPCNSDKRDLGLDEWAADRKRRGLTPRSLSPHVRHLTHALLAA